MIKKKILIYIASFSVVVLLLLPGVAQASTYAELQGAVKQSFSLCALDKEEYADMCDYSIRLNDLQNKIKDKTPEQQAAAIDEFKPAFKSVNFFIKNKFYIEASEKRINNDGSIATGTALEGKDTCGDDVDVSVDVGCDGTGNPIIDYLRAIIVFLGGLIGLALVITLIVSGIQYASSAGEPANIAKAKERIFNAVIGLILYILLAAVLRYIIPGVFA